MIKKFIAIVMVMVVMFMVGCAKSPAPNVAYIKAGDAIERVEIVSHEETAQGDVNLYCVNGEVKIVPKEYLDLRYEKPITNTEMHSEEESK